MNRIQVLFIAALAALATTAQERATLKVWPNGAPNSNDTITTVEDSIRWHVVDEPVLHVFPADNPSGKVVLMLPGGGYRHLTLRTEGNDFVPWYNGQGVDVAILQYRMPNGHPEVPLSDVHQSMRMLREMFPGRRIGVQGFSAGGHLASTAATHYDDAVTRPDFQILFYPVIAVSGDVAHKGSATRLLGPNPDEALVKLYDNHLQVTADTPQAFVVHSADDKVVLLANSLLYGAALNACKVPLTLVVYPHGGHGWGYNPQFKYSELWHKDLEFWLSNLE